MLSCSITCHPLISVTTLHYLHPFSFVPSKHCLSLFLILIGGVLRGSYAVLMAVVAQVLLMITEYWVRWWAGGTFYPERDITNLGILGALTGLCIFIGFYRAITWFDFTLAASSNLHEKSLWAVLHSPLQFFISNPTGEVSVIESTIIETLYQCCVTQRHTSTCTYISTDT